jgi:hypothetical protein
MVELLPPGVPMMCLRFSSAAALRLPISGTKRLSGLDEHSMQSPLVRRGDDRDESRCHTSARGG